LQEKTVNAEEAARFQTYLKNGKMEIDEALEQYLPGEENHPSLIFKAMRYSLFAGGKRIRPILCLAAVEALGAEELRPSILPVACALELIHTYSLIHDDLPAMDNDDFRRGVPTSHKVFGEDIAILAGDALLTEAFSLMSRRELMEDIPPERILRVIHEVASAAGCFGMIGGQVADVRSEEASLNEETLYYIHSSKTGALILASVRAGALLAGASRENLDALSTYGRSIGLAFQIVDDILNVEGDRTITGKSTGSDASHGKITFPAVFGMEESRKKAGALVEQALCAVSGFDDRAYGLRMVAKHIMERKS
jgi:geranylgeranyl diphosphate synthase type II